MSELLPTSQAERIRDGLVDYLRTTFALADADAGAALEEFLGDPENGIFKGPYLRLRLPFRPAAEGWRESLDWYGAPFPPYGHQSAAFQRLTTLGHSGERPLPTLVTTGTGSGKTEAFLYPILDHVRRAKAAGVTGMKALILYPMNALANDQAGRLARIISGDSQLDGVTAALYTGQDGPQRTVVREDGLITVREVIRSSAPDILLTNYKMLDQMLLRAADARIWEQSAHSLQYLVLDEFHTYDGAQGTDVSMLLRRVGMAIKSHWAADDRRLTPADWERPLGRITPVATSATLGDRGDPAAMLSFASTVFGETFDDAAVITETRLTAQEWAGDAESVPMDEDTVHTTLERIGRLTEPEGAAIARAVTSILAGRDVDEAAEQLEVLRNAALTRDLAVRAGDATAVDDLVDLVPGDPAQASAYLLAFVAALSHVRAVVGREALSVDLHLWVRELTRIDRAVSLVTSFHWSDDGEVAADGLTTLPAIYCRHCGRSGWAVVLAPVGEELDTPSAGIRGSRLTNSERFRALIHAPGEGERVEAGEVVEGFRWLISSEARLGVTLPDDEVSWREGRVLPVLTHTGEDAADLSKSDTCPSCLRREGIRFLGSAIATLLSVSMSTIFGTPGLDRQEKKALVFTDSVQDAAHRAGFIQSRSHSLTLRTVIREAIGERETSLDFLADRIITLAGDDPHRRYRLLPPDLAEQKRFEPFWEKARQSQVPAAVMRRVRRRLLLDVILEFGLQSRVGRTLELTGSVAAHVDVAAGRLGAIGQSVLTATAAQPLEPIRADQGALVAWVRGTLERLRERGGIQHEWFTRYQNDDGNRYSIWGGRPRADGMPAFPSQRPAPGFARIGGPKQRSSDLDPVAAQQGWYTLWTARTLGVPPAEAAALARELFGRLAQAGILAEVNATTGARLFHLTPSSIVLTPVSVADLTTGRVMLHCTVCQTLVPGSVEVIDQLEDRPCMLARCPGTLRRQAGQDNFYRHLYGSSDAQRVVAREHTGQLSDEDRLKYEKGFKSSAAEPQEPNVLVATPTLEMGIDIGDLSTVMLASLPTSVASYLQRVGRAGRATGNALNLAFVTGRGDQLPRLGDPLSVINGAVRPPATYLDAEEILRRQYVASVADRLARDASAPHPQRATEAMNSTDDGGFLRTLIQRAEDNAGEYLASFLAGFPSLGEQSKQALREWATPPAGPGTSELAQRLNGQALRWALTIEQLDHRVRDIEGSLADLQQRAESPAATDDDKRAWRTARAALLLTRRLLAEQRGEYWIGVLEERGILPNYTLVDDSVALDVALSWIDPDTGQFEEETESFQRGSAQALRDFAPGATYYGRGHRIVVDAVELGLGNDGLQSWVFCPSCGHNRALGDGAPGACPRCGDGQFADVAQCIEVVELTRASSAMRREEASIDDSNDERIRERFTVAACADIDPAKVTRQWFVENIGMGVRHLRDLRILWTNLGRAGASGLPRIISGDEHSVPLFRLCAHCGQLDTDTQANRPSEHRSWCPQRKKHEEDTRTIGLTRTLSTEGLLLRLPALTALDDVYAIPSLSAALLLGLRERIGGAPDHLAITSTVDPDPTPDTVNHDALLLHDIVPGGTGYLADLADPAELWAILRLAWERVRTCECAGEDRQACHRCLLPFAGPGRGADLVSRVAAERHLHRMLVGDADADSGDVPAEMTWTLTEVPVISFDPETRIEQRFRRVLIDRLEAAGARVTEKPGPVGNRLSIRAGNRSWTLEPQLNLGPARPDFVLQSNQPDLPWVAIFCDGWRYHASAEFPRLTDDAQKRAVLREAGHLVLGVTWRDLEEAEDPAVRPPAPPWFSAASAQAVKSSGSGWTQRRVDVLAGGVIDLLVDWVTSPDRDGVARVANWLPLVVARDADKIAPGEGSLVDLARSVLVGSAVEGTGAWAWSLDTAVVVCRHVGGPYDNVEVALLIDDRESALGLDHRPAWEAWLSLSNALALRERPTVITTWSAAPAEAPAPVERPVPDSWAEIYDAATEGERALLRQLGDAGVPLPELGAETENGVPLALSWPAYHLVVDPDLDDFDRAELAEDGWSAVGVDEAIARLTEGVGA